MKCSAFLACEMRNLNYLACFRLDTSRFMLDADRSRLCAIVNTVIATHIFGTRFFYFDSSLHRKWIKMENSGTKIEQVVTVLVVAHSKKQEARSKK